MTRTKRTIGVSVICGLLVLGLSGVGQTAERTPTASEQRTFVISGSVGMPGVMLQGLPGNPLTDENGVYSEQVESGWSGTVTPVKEGYVFEPPSRVYSAVERDLSNEIYQVKLLTCTISGNVGAPQVDLQGLPGQVRSDRNGSYSVEVSYGWSGAVTPAREGLVFSPPAKTYNSVVRDMPEQNYDAEVLTCTISGNVGVAGVALLGLPGNLTTDARGSYSTEVEYGWTGVVVPEKAGYEFDPPQRQYERVRENQTKEDFVGRVQTLTISDMIVLGDEPIPGVTVTADPGEYTAVTDSAGRYIVKVPHGWSGALTLSKEGFAFNPSALPYTNVTDHIIDGRRMPASQEPAIPLPKGPTVRPQAAVAGATGEIVMIPTSRVDPAVLTQVKEDMGVMLQILREKLSEPRTILGALYDYGDFFGSGGRQVEALYLQGYGAVFVMEVSFPLSPVLEAGSADGNEPEQAVDPVWQRARQRMYAPPGGAYGRRRTPVQADQASFEQFKEDMVKTLKHAANIRQLTSDESVVLTIVGQREEPAGAFGRMSGRNPYGGGGPYGGGFVAGGGSSSGGFSSSGGASMYSRSSSYSSTSSRGATSRGRGRLPDAAPAARTVLTIAATKADIDAFAQGDLDFDEFSKRVRTFSY